MIQKYIGPPAFFASFLLTIFLLRLSDKMYQLGGDYQRLSRLITSAAMLGFGFGWLALFVYFEMIRP